MLPLGTLFLMFFPALGPDPTRWTDCVAACFVTMRVSTHTEAAVRLDALVSRVRALVDGFLLTLPQLDPTALVDSLVDR